MNCEFIKNHLDEICSDQLDTSHLKEAKKHIACCDDCTELTEQHQIYLNTMKQFESPELSTGSARTMLIIARQNDSKPYYSSFSVFIKGFATASAIFICLLSLFHFFPNNLETVIVSQQNALFATEVTLVISVPKDMQNAGLTIILPDNVALASHKGLKELNWITDLKEGANSLSLPIEIVSDQDLSNQLNFIAKINYNNQQKEFNLNVNLDASQNQT